MYTQLSLLDLLPLSPCLPCPPCLISAPEHDPYWDECVKEQVTADTSNAQKPDNCVREQVANDTDKVAPEHIHWTEEYWVERNQKKYYYWRYCWMEGRKIRRCHIGSVRSLEALGNYQAIRCAIARNQSPQEVKQLIKPKTDFSTIVQKFF
ncbi:hypothetical protein OGM63_05730 [Plectonema radiosum NIES-515]|uniref:Uncharacterized protein n=1 Tax=Plectonema radiosum NIES-515 TaxID=2986073 RepID=A0ABT3AV81_9CYAN|nr:hypothetical protein [Plectonema radiosum]MCV3213031.1 hypothetical protein [Plectonema radiosum NIES-515]